MVCLPALFPGHGQGMSHVKRVIVTAAGPAMRSAMHDLAIPSFRAYADVWGWDVLAYDLRADGAGADRAAQRAKWQKVRLLRDALASHELVLWLDADVLIRRTDDDIAAHLAPHAFQALALEQVPSENRLNPNTGVWLLRSARRAFSFLDAVLRHGQQPGPWADQGAVLAALGWDRGDESYHWARPGRGSRFMTSTSWLPAAWNQPYQGPRQASDAFNSAADSYADRPVVPAPHALHFMGMTPQARYRAMRATAERGARVPAA